MIKSKDHLPWLGPIMHACMHADHAFMHWKLLAKQENLLVLDNWTALSLSPDFIKFAKNYSNSKKNYKVPNYEIQGAQHKASMKEIIWSPKGKS